MIILGQGGIISGIYIYRIRYNSELMLEWIELGVFIGIILFFEFFYQIYLTKEVNLEPSKILNKKYISLNEFKNLVEKKGEKLVILDDYIIDIANFLTIHPGGSFSLS